MATTRDSIEDVWGARTPHEPGQDWPVRVDERTLSEPERWVQAACVLCSNGCGCDIGVRDGRIVGVRGRAGDVVNKGRLGPKGLHGFEANHSPDRLTCPRIRRDGGLVEASWDEAMDLIVSKSHELCERFTPSSIGFYTSGQLFLEEYYTLGMIGKAGLGTPHMDGNTRLCTATSAAALKESFGSDGQPGAYEDIDVTDCILHVGHNIASTDTVLWMRVLDRRRGANPPKLIVIDPRATPTAKEADLHLAPRLGTNVALLNGLLQRLIERGYVDRGFIEAHTIGFERLCEVVTKYTPEYVATITGVPAEKLIAAADLIGRSSGLLSSCLQGVYQSNQATAAACQVNNINLVLGRIGRPGSGVLQMNGQPTAQNTRETGADGDLPGFRNWANPKHVQELARLWNVEADKIPHWAPPTHALQIFRYCETGSIRMLWIQATNPAVSMPDLARIRRILAKEDLFVVVSDAFMTETAELADVVLPAAIWGEKTGCSTNVSRVVHLSKKAIEPPGEARADLDIFLDYARRMDFRDKDGAPLIKWSDAEGAFDAWRECTRGRPCDYTGLSYQKLSGPSGIPWPCNEQHPDGSPRYYADLRFATEPDYCESYGHDLATGAPLGREHFMAMGANGRAILRAADYQPPAEEPDADYPFFLTTGRVVYHFHTRTKTGRSRALREAAPDAYLQLSHEDAARLHVQDGDWLRVSSRRGAIEVRAALGDVESGQVFVPFHFGYWDEPERSRAANELTIFAWDPVSKQPHFKYAAVRLEKIQAPSMHARASVPNRSDAGKESAPAASGRPHLADYLGLLQASEARLVKAFAQVRDTHTQTPDIHGECLLFEGWSQRACEQLHHFIERYGEREHGEPERLDRALLVQRRETGFDLVRDLHDLFLLVNESMISAAILVQAATAKHDSELLKVVQEIEQHNERQRRWLFARARQAAPQALLVPS
ncbi:MAG: molybdopterin oxidoreductase [Myxococcaceae bacterium]|nr:molybdopterin oxidoreductase [Myxococcaceae bacterium]